MLNNRFLGAVLLVIGTCIGAGMLALPVTSAPAGFFPAVALLGVCWIVMYLSGLLILEINLQLPNKSSFISMAEATLGRAGKHIAWVSYLALLYTLIAAYLSGGGDIVSHLLQKASMSLQCSYYLSPLPWMAIIGTMIYLGTGKADLLNRLCMIGLVGSFCILAMMMIPHIHTNTIGQSAHIRPLSAALPVVITAFGYHVIIPSVCAYLSGHVRQLKRCIFWGSLVPLLVYFLWEIEVFGIVPLYTKQGLIHILQQDHIAVDLSSALAHLLHNPWVAISAACFMFFALASSFIGIALSLFDLLADAFPISDRRLGRFCLSVMTLLPPFLYSIAYPGGFILALRYAGIFVAILNAMLPALMVWASRRHSIMASPEQAPPYRVPGGYLTLWIVMAFSALVMILDIWR